MFKVKSVLKVVTPKEVVFGIPLGLFWIVLQYYRQYAATLYPFVLVLTFILYFINKTREERKQFYREEMHSERMKDAFNTIRDIVHQIRGPLAGLKMACGQLAEDPSNQELVLVLTRAFPKQVEELFELTAVVARKSNEFTEGVRLKGE